LIDVFKSDFKKQLLNCLTKSNTNKIKFKVNINEEIYRKFLNEAQFSVSEENYKYLEISEENFLLLFIFDLKDYFL
jgi:hypothetical protein